MQRGAAVIVTSSSPSQLFEVLPRAMNQRRDDAEQQCRGTDEGPPAKRGEPRKHVTESRPSRVRIPEFVTRQKPMAGIPALRWLLMTFVDALRAIGFASSARLVPRAPNSSAPDDIPPRAENLVVAVAPETRRFDAASHSMVVRGRRASRP